MGIVLASRSPRRRQLLEQMGLRDFRIVCSDADETASPGLTPPALVEALSARKAAAVQHAAAAGDLIIAADTVVALDGRVLGKMGHTERSGAGLYQNVPGAGLQPVFESGVDYFR